MIGDWLKSLWEWSPLVTVAIGVAMVFIVVGWIDVLLLGRAAFVGAGRSRAAWMLLMLCFGPLAVLLYFAAVRPPVAHPERYADDVFADDVPADHGPAQLEAELEPIVER